MTVMTVTAATAMTATTVKAKTPHDNDDCDGGESKMAPKNKVHMYFAFGLQIRPKKVLQEAPKTPKAGPKRPHPELRGFGGEHCARRPPASWPRF
jgi:hypothetical protein